jgi:hypothetical protein
MLSRNSLRALLFLSSTAALACGGGETVSPSNEPPANIAPVSDLARTAAVGSAVTGGLVVKVTDAQGRPVKGATVAFAVTQGNGTTNPRLATTDANGQAATQWTLGTIVGGNEVSASVNGVGNVVHFQASGIAGAVTTISLSTQNARLLVNVDTARITAKALDAFGNSTAPAPTFTVRDPTLISIDDAGLVRALRRGSSTYVVATAGSKSDSALVTVLSSGQSICTNAANPVQLTVGQVITDVSGSGFCVRGNADGAEYAIIPFYNASVNSATTQIEVRGAGVSPLTAASSAVFDRSVAEKLVTVPSIVPNYAGEARMRAQERAEIARRAGAAGTWRGAPDQIASSATVQLSVPAVGDLLKLNTNAFDFCDNPDYRYGRVVAITNKAIVVADTANPAGGFTADEYKSIGVTFDTLVDVVDRKAFGDPSDIDNNGHVIMFFTRAVNEMTARGSGSVYLGFTYQRDLFPKSGPLGTCDGSNVGEMFYLMVPDTGGVVSDKRKKADVVSFTLGTVAHEYQHLINGSRRLYVNKYGPTFEEKWLDEGLAHIAEDLNFWASSKKSPRSNLDVSLFNDPNVSAAYGTFANFNRTRYGQYLGRTESQGPIGFDANDDDLFTRGAIWSFLRYAADRLGPGAEDQLWFKLVNNNATGMTNLTSALGTDPGPWLRDWAISVFLDDNVAGTDARFQQPSWNLRSIFTNGGTGISFPLVTRSLRDNIASVVNLSAFGVSFLRFNVVNGQDALLTVTSNGQPLPSAVQLAVVRVR